MANEQCNKSSLPLLYSNSSSLKYQILTNDTVKLPHLLNPTTKEYYLIYLHLHLKFSQEVFDFRNKPNQETKLLIKLCAF